MYLYIQYITCITRIKKVRRNRTLLAPSRRSAAPHSPLQNLCREQEHVCAKCQWLDILRRVCQANLFFCACLMENSASRKRWQQVHIRPRGLSAKIFPKFALNKTEKLEKLCRASVLLSSLNPIAESGIMPEGSCCKLPCTCNINAWVLRTKYYHISLHKYAETWAYPSPANLTSMSLLPLPSRFNKCKPDQDFPSLYLGSLPLSRLSENQRKYSQHRHNRVAGQIHITQGKSEGI